MQVWFSNRRARLRKTLGSATSTFPSSAGLGSYSAAESFPSHSGYQWASSMASSAYLNYPGYSQDKAAQYYPGTQGWSTAGAKAKEGAQGLGASWGAAGSHLPQEYNSLLATSYPASSQAFHQDQTKYLAAGLSTDAKYGGLSSDGKYSGLSADAKFSGLTGDAKYSVSESKYGMGEPSGLETKYSNHLATQHSQQEEEKHQQYLGHLAAQSMCRPVH